MHESYFALSPEDRLSARPRRRRHAVGAPSHLLEKDVKVVWAIDGLFGRRWASISSSRAALHSPRHMTSSRFSEDIDVTYDVRESSRSCEGRKPADSENRQPSREMAGCDRPELAAWVKDVALPILQKHADKTGAKVTLRAEGADLFVDYHPLRPAMAMCRCA